MPIAAAPTPACDEGPAHAAAQRPAFKKRVDESQHMMKQYPDRIPVLCERALRSTLPQNKSKKFLVPGTMLIGEFKYIIFKELHKNTGDAGVIDSDQTVYLFVSNGISPLISSPMSEIYEKHKDQDGFLYVKYSAENTLGGEKSSLDL